MSTEEVPALLEKLEGQLEDVQSPSRVESSRVRRRVDPLWRGGFKGIPKDANLVWGDSPHPFWFLFLGSQPFLVGLFRLIPFFCMGEQKRSRKDTALVFNRPLSSEKQLTQAWGACAIGSVSSNRKIGAFGFQGEKGEPPGLGCRETPKGA